MHRSILHTYEVFDKSHGRKADEYVGITIDPEDQGMKRRLVQIKIRRFSQMRHWFLTGYHA